jgi:two-component system nitrate/nitrite response regulator NarL
MKSIRTLLVDDHRIVLDGLLAVLSDQKEIEVLETAQSGEQALAILKRLEVDVLVLDYSLEDKGGAQMMNGLDTAKAIRLAYPEIKILMLTMHHSKDIILPCIEAGVHGYVIKGERNFDMARAILELWKNGYYFSPEVSAQLAMNLRQYQQEKVLISTREQEVLDCLFTGDSTKQIAEKLFISTNTVETHRKNLLSKFEAQNTTALIYKALKRGLLSL